MSRETVVRTDAGDIVVRRHTAITVHRVGFAPTPWQWTDWAYAEDGRFDGRWDDPGGSWRTLYVGETRLACLLELLARFRPSSRVSDELAEIEVDGEDEFPTIEAGTIPPDWCEVRCSGTAMMSGSFAVPGDHRSLAALRSRFRMTALGLGLDDLDAAAIRDARPRTLTRGIASWLHGVTDVDDVPLDGIEFTSRHGDDLTLWAIFERSRDGDVSAILAPRFDNAGLGTGDADLNRAMELLGVRWAD